MPRDHMMGFIQPNDETHGVGYRKPWPLGFQKNETPEEKRESAKIRAALTKRLDEHEFETIDHTPMYMREYPPLVVNPAEPPLICASDYWTQGQHLTCFDKQRINCYTRLIRLRAVIDPAKPGTDKTAISTVKMKAPSLLDWPGDLR